MGYMRRAITVTLGLLLAVLAWASPGGQASATQKGSAISANARHNLQGRGIALVATLAPSVPADQSIFDVPPGGVPWQLTQGHVVLGRDGLLVANVAGLVVTTSGSNPIPDLAASVYCNGTLAARTAPVPFSTQGNAHIRASLSPPLPAFCPAPAVLLNPAMSPTNVLGVYIAFDGTT